MTVLPGHRHYLALDEAVEVIERLRDSDVEAVRFLWSIINPEHEIRLGRLLETHLPGVPFTLSHQVNPSLREFRRASATAIDASLKPIMGGYMGGLGGPKDTQNRLLDDIALSVMSIPSAGFIFPRNRFRSISRATTPEGVLAVPVSDRHTPAHRTRPYRP